MPAGVARRLKISSSPKHDVIGLGSGKLKHLEFDPETQTLTVTAGTAVHYCISIHNIGTTQFNRIDRDTAQ